MTGHSQTAGMRYMLLLLLALTGLAFGQEACYGTVVARDATSLTVKDPQGALKVLVLGKTQLPSWVAPGKKVKVTCQELRVAVKSPNGQRVCEQAFEAREVAPCDGRLPDPGKL